MTVFGNQSIPLTSQLDKSLDGALQINFTQQCNLNLLTIKPLQVEKTLNWHDLSSQKQALFIKCFLIIQCLSEDAIDEANEDLARILEFYSDKLTQNSGKTLLVENPSLQTKILPPKIRPSLVLDDF